MLVQECQLRRLLLLFSRAAINVVDGTCWTEIPGDPPLPAHQGAASEKIFGEADPSKKCCTSLLLACRCLCELDCASRDFGTKWDVAEAEHHAVGNEEHLTGALIAGQLWFDVSGSCIFVFYHCIAYV